MPAQVTEWIVVVHRGVHEHVIMGPTVHLEDAERVGDRDPLYQVKQVADKMGGCKDWLGYYLSINTTDGEHYKVRET